VSTADAGIIRRIDVGAGLNEELRCFKVVPVGSPVLGCRPVALGRVHAGALHNECTDRCGVLILDGINHPEIAAQ
jgi:hypothetical protein